MLTLVEAKVQVTTEKFKILFVNGSPSVKGVLVEFGEVTIDNVFIIGAKIIGSLRGIRNGHIGSEVALPTKFSKVVFVGLAIHQDFLLKLSLTPLKVILLKQRVEALLEIEKPSL